jgi:uncharacterized YccA/Bax inhibitor family protein
MQTRNPVLSREVSRYATFNAPTASPEHLQEMYDGRPVALATVTIHDVIMRTAAMFAVLLVTAVVSWNVVSSAPWIIFVSLFVGLGLALVNTFKRDVSPPLILAYAAVEGVFLGSLSWAYNNYWGTGAGNANIVGEAVVGTLVAFGVMLALYGSGKLRATPRFVKMFTVAIGAYFLIAIVSLFSAFLGVGRGWGFYGVGGLGLLLCVAGVALAAFSLVLDFDAIEKGIAAGLPEKEAWRMAFGLVVSLVWLYLELLRLLAILQGGGRR